MRPAAMPVVFAASILLAAPVFGGTFTVEFQDVTDANGIGFDDPGSVSSGPCGATTLGALRRCTALKALDDLGALITFAPGATPKILFTTSDVSGSAPAGVASSFFDASLGNPQNGFLYAYISSGTDPVNGPELRVKMNFAPTILNGVLSTMNPDYLVIDQSKLDLYTVVLHEAMHGLGIGSLIGSTGKSKLTASTLGPYSGFDRFLVPAGSTATLLTGAVPSFTGAVSALTSNGVEYYEPGNAIARLPVLSSAPFNPGSSLSHFDATRPPANAAGTAYSGLAIDYVMGSGRPVRSVTPPERDVLCDLGYDLGTTCNDRFPIGIDDLAASTPQGNQVCLNVVTNDIDADGDPLVIDPLLGVRILNGDGPGASATFSGGSLCYTSPPGYTGMAALEYNPSDGTRTGTKAVVRVPITGTECAGDPCNLICNGGFEGGVPTNTSIGFEAFRNCPSMVDNWCPYNGSADYFIRGNTGQVNKVPQFTMAPGCVNGIDTWDTPNGQNNRFIGMIWPADESVYVPLLKTLVPGRTYRLKYHAIAGAGQAGRMAVGFLNSLSSSGIDYSLPDQAINNCDDPWSSISVTFTPPPGSTLKYMVVHGSRISPPTTGQQYVFVDDFFLAEDGVPASVAVTVDNPTPHIGEVVQYSISVCNNGPTSATIVVQDFLPAGLSPVGGTFGYPVKSITLGGFSCNSWTVQALVTSAAAVGIPLTDCGVIVSGGTACGPLAGNGCADITIPNDAAICGRVWYDVNRDGIHDSTEPGLWGRIMSLAAPNGFTTIEGTFADGSFCYSDLAPGAYTVHTTVPSGWNLTYPASVDHQISLAPGVALQGVEFGEAPLATCQDALSWQALGTGTGDSPFALTAIYVSTSPDIYAAGAFTTAGGASANHVALWTGAWTPLGSGIDGNVFALAEFKGDLYAAGSFTHAGGVAANNIARWNGHTWSAVGSGTNDEIITMRVFRDGSGPPMLYVAGTFTTAGGQAANLIARWDGASWSSVGTGIAGSQVNALASFDDGGGQALVACGVFHHAGGVAANQVARFRAGAWSAMGSLTGGAPFALQLHDAGLGMGAALYAGGDVTGRVLRWDGGSWTAIGAGMDYPVLALASFNENGVQKLVAGGNFEHAGTGVAKHVAAWNGSSWSEIGGGLDSQVNALLVADGWLYAGGFFDHATSLTAHRIARWGCKTGGGPPPGFPAVDPLPLKRPRLALAALPNPARGTQTLRMVLPQSAEVDVRLFDAAGRLVRRLVQGRQLAGLHTMTWDGTDERGVAVGVGVFVLRAESEGMVHSLKIVRLP